jgi:hypothetical protein
MKMLTAIVLAGVVFIPAQAEARCSPLRYNIIEQQRIATQRTLTPGATCTHRMNSPTLGIAEIKVIQRPAQGEIIPAETGRGSFSYRSKPGASGDDRYVIRAEFDRINGQTGRSFGKTWAEIEYFVRFER